MRQIYDPGTDALYIRFAEGVVEESAEVAPGVVLDYDADNRIIGLEVLNASRRMAEGFVPVAAE
jgi:uncharacterized protein YuzE